MAMTNFNYNNQNDTHSKQQSTQPSPKQLPLSNSPNCHYSNYTAANLSNLSPIYEGEVFASPTNTISPSISHNTIDNNHVVLFHNGHPKNNNDSISISPTTSVSSSNSSNTPTPTHTPTPTPNSLFNINNSPRAPCIPSVGLINANMSKASTSSSSPSPSLDTTVSPVTKMDLFRDLKIFEELDTDTNNNIAIDYLTGDTHNYMNTPKKENQTAKESVQYDTTDFPNIYLQNPPKPTPIRAETVSALNKTHKKQNPQANNRKTHKKSHRHHSHSRKRKKKKKTENYSDSDSELQKKGKIKDKIKNISILVPGDPNGLYKYWKTNVKNRDRLHSYPPNNMYNAPHCTSPASSNSSTMSLPIKISKSQSCSNLQDMQQRNIIITKNDENIAYNMNKYSFRVMGLTNYQNKMNNRVRMNTYPPIKKQQEWHYTSKNEINGQNYGCYYGNNACNNKIILPEKWKDEIYDEEPLPLESLAHIKGKRKRKKIAQNSSCNVYNIHPSIAMPSFMKNENKHGNLYDL